jgi:radical SAM superfamily enzyme YgiQ (UPF0313 family)
MDPMPYLNSGADLAVVGEGEETVREVLEHGEKDLDEIPGIASFWQINRPSLRC